MNMTATKGAARPKTPAAANIGSPAYLDPLDDDRPGDDVVVTTRRAISRIALVAAETAGRFQREGVPHDAMTWMLAPLALFSGSNALEACLDRDACLRGILIHGLSLGLDADPMTIDALTADDDTAYDDVGCELSPHGFAPDAATGGFRSNVLSFPEPTACGLRLFTATLVASDGFETVQAFHASLAMDEVEVAGRLYCRIGAAAADAKILKGFDPTDPLVAALVSDVMCDTLALIAAEPTSPIAAGLDVNIEQRFYG
ncbi:hypothetical protein [Sphingomonas sp. UYEF23]|uniref:hypothetical protein n=1 Tax=Sphingomonas sp. UYEF23 TaxID=1756408 RepID=UPI003393EB50